MMKMSTVFNIINITLLIGGIIFIVVTALDIVVHRNDVRTIQTNCYDRDRHLILNLTCEEKVICGWGIGTTRCEK
jgi:hypothetical protein